MKILIGGRDPILRDHAAHHQAVLKKALRVIRKVRAAIQPVWACHGCGAQAATYTHGWLLVWRGFGGWQYQCPSCAGAPRAGRADPPTPTT